MGSHQRPAMTSFIQCCTLKAALPDPVCESRHASNHLEYQAIRAFLGISQTLCFCLTGWHRTREGRMHAFFSLSFRLTPAARVWTGDVAAANHGFVMPGSGNPPVGRSKPAFSKGSQRNSVNPCPAVHGGGSCVLRMTMGWSWCC